MKVLVVVPTHREAASLGAGVEPFVCGTGKGLGDAVAARLAADRPEVVLLAGYCGALDPSMAAGGVILARHVLAPGQPEIAPDRLLLEEVRKQLHKKHFPFVFSRLLTVERPVARKARKLALWNEFGAAGVDMETYAVAGAAAAAGLPWLAVRTVVDTSKQTLPRAVAKWGGEGDTRAIARDALRHPLQWAAYVRLARQERRARLALARAIPVLLEAIAGAKVVEAIPVVESNRG